MSKGSNRRPEAKPGVYAENHERIFGKKEELQELVVSEFGPDGFGFTREVVDEMSRRAEACGARCRCMKSTPCMQLKGHEGPHDRHAHH